ncbi:MAG: AAA family ATPase [Algicola sp.]|nr:AAA family ATPase [Algicola sp.]
MNENTSQCLEAVEKALEDKILSCLDLDNPKSFLLFAGAGSGKTRTLVSVLRTFRKKYVQRLVHSGQKVAIITYTNAACDEIKHRLDYDPAFSVSTIHSFAWQLIKPFTEDIRQWLQDKLAADITDLQGKISKSTKPEGVTALRYARSLESKNRRLLNLDKVTRFTYSPTGGSTTKDALNHTEIISMTACFLADAPLMQKILVNRYPVLLIDESQDTDQKLLEAFIETQQNHRTSFSLGLFGDMMQRIYGGGKHDLATSLPADWVTPDKIVNHRCPKRVITLINKIRNEPQHQQQPRIDSQQGHARLFIVNAAKAGDKFVLEASIRNEMSNIASDRDWREAAKVKTLTLEHHLAAVRGGFDGFFAPLLRVDKLRDAALNGTSSEMNFLTQQLLPLITQIKNSDDFAIATIVRRYSPLLHVDHLACSDNAIGEVQIADEAIVALGYLLESTKDITIILLLQTIDRLGLLSLPESFEPLLIESSATENLADEEEDKVSQAWGQALNAPFTHLEHYADYLSASSGFGTHQGVKGLQFERVMVILDDAEERGFLFNYEKLLGAKALSATDLKNESAGIDSTPLRTCRLFYVTCSRAEKSLAVVAYTQDQVAVKNHVLQSGWFEESEVICLP